MPKGYVTVTNIVTNQDGMMAYTKKAVPTIFTAGGTIVIAGPPDTAEVWATYSRRWRTT